MRCLLTFGSACASLLQQSLRGLYFAIDIVIRMLYIPVMVKTLTAIRLKERDLAELQRLAAKEDETVSSLIRIAVREYLDRKKAGK